jgi:hypothetical protein
MKKLVLTLAFIATAFTFSIAQNPPHPNGGGGPGSGNTPVGGGAPIGGGLIIMTILAIGYGSKKTFQFNKVNNLDK